MGTAKLSTVIQHWLESHAQRHACLSIAGAAASLFGGIVTVLLGPGLVVTSWRLLVRAKRLFLLDTAACAKPIAAVLKAGRKVPLEDLAARHPHFDWERVLPQLCLIDGVVILRSEPVGVAITDGLRDTIGEWRAAHKDDE